MTAAGEKEPDMTDSEKEKYKKALEKRFDEMDALQRAYMDFLKDSRTDREILTANLECWTDEMAEYLAENFVAAVNEPIKECRRNIDKATAAIDSLNKEVVKLRRNGGVKSFLILLSVICNIGCALFIVAYLLGQGGTVFI